MKSIRIATILFSVFALATYKVNAQTKPALNNPYFTSRSFFEKALVAELSHWKRTDLVSNSTDEPVIVSSTPKRIRMSFSYKSGNGTIKSSWIETLYEGGYPIGVFMGLMPAECLLPYNLSQEIGDMFSTAECNKIGALNKAYREKVRKNNPSYKEVMREWSAYPASYSMTNALAAESYTDQSSYTYNKSVQIDVNRDINVPTTVYSYTTITMLKNASNHPVVIKGIFIKRTLGEHLYSYSNASKILQPGGSIEKIDIQKEFDEYQTNTTQYIGIAGKIAGLEEEPKEVDAETIPAIPLGNNRYEVNSYTRVTNISVKKGDKISIEASGNIVLGSYYPASSADGVSSSSEWKYVDDYPFGALIASVGETNIWELIGIRKTFVAGNSGILKIRVNDTYPDDNGGSFKIKITVVKSTK